jgi:starch-binding outer membrane protein, SusD/RagB family
MKRMWVPVKKYVCIVMILFLLTAVGCKKLVQVDEPDDSLTTSTVFSNDSLAQAAVDGLYIKIMNSSKFLLNGGMSLFPGLSADELVRTTTSTNEDQFYYNAISPKNLFLNSNLWKAAYSHIYQCNICIEGLHKSTGVTNELKTRLTGEVLFVRALCYYYLVNLFGDVPVVVGTNADVNALLSRAPASQVYLRIEADLLAASDALSASNNKSRPTQYAAKALLARAYLYMQNWSKAAEMASAVINSGQFFLEGDLNTVFKTTSKEAIFQWAPVVDKVNSPEGLIFIPSNANLRPNYALTAGLLAAFEPGDLRKKNWINTVTLSQAYSYPYKYKIFLSNNVSEYNVVLRLAEQYLIRSEALGQLNRITEAVDDVNRIRSRAQLPEIATSISRDQFFQTIEQERRVELFAEWGHRWFDLKRTNRADAVLNVKGSNWQLSDQLYPIPFSELETGPNLEQNPGYDQ